MKVVLLALGLSSLASVAAMPCASAEPSQILAKAAPRAVTVARTTRQPGCTLYVDQAFAGTSDGSKAKPYRTIASAVSKSRGGAVICVAEGEYPESLTPGTKFFTLAGGFKSGASFAVRDSARYVTTAKGNGGSFISIVDPGPKGNQLTAIDGFEITGYEQAIVRDIYYPQRFDVTNNDIHDNACTVDGVAGAGFALNNVSGSIRGNVFENNRCWRGGAGALNDTTNSNRMVIAQNLIVGNAGTEVQIAHGGALYLFGNKITLTANRFEKNSTTGWGGGLYLGAFTPGGQRTTAKLSWNVYKANRAGIAGGGLFCDDSAHCLSDHEIYDGNCGGNIYLDAGPDGAEGTVGRFNHLTNVNARTSNCAKPGTGVQIDKYNAASDSYAFTNALFFGNAPRLDFSTNCDANCGKTTIQVDFSMVDKRFRNAGLKITFGAGIVAPKDPRFVSPKTGDFHLKSTFGHFTPTGYVKDAKSSPALAKGDPASSNKKSPPRAGPRSELGAYGNSIEASYVR